MINLWWIAALATIGLIGSSLLMGALSAGSHFLTEQRLNDEKHALWQQVRQHLGRIHVVWSDATLRQAQRSTQWLALAELVAVNLVMNAVKHGFNDTQPGSVSVACAREGDRARITVTDNGIGVPPENIGKIFDPFFTTKRGQGGTGLGLHISHNMVYGPLGGRLTAQSTPGVATTFTLVLPCVAPGLNRA